MNRFLPKLMRYVHGGMSTIGQLEPRDFLRVATNSDDVIKVMRQYGFAIALNLNDQAIGLPILLKGSYEENVTQVFLNHLKPDTHFLDIGANIGYYSLLAASQCPNGKIISFEPDNTNFRLFKTSIAYNGFDFIIHPHKLAASNQNDSLIMYDVGKSANSGAKVTAKDKESLNPYLQTKTPDFKTVEAVAIDSFLTDERIDLVKLDVEGHEPFAIQGMTQLLQRDRPIIFTEFAPVSLSHISKTAPETFLQSFIDLNYQLNIIDENGNLIHCQQDKSMVLTYFQQQKVNHIDLLLNWL